ncbi:protein WHAT'S THIS FACTOR 1 homolog, chloroplastic [Silene latifolia]|uniref:protein WHAT'S THIS FACTOR 1 homolog, chloroplastic n=1 Tax=Silene latifolia TaxID=37657 RepID=UPI003D77417E
MLQTLNMALCPPVLLTQKGRPLLGEKSEFMTPGVDSMCRNEKVSVCMRRFRKLSLTICYSAPLRVRDRSLDRHVVKQNKIRFVQKLRTLLLSKPKHFMSIHILSKCRSYLCLEKPRSMVSMIQRYPTIFELFYIPYPQTPLNATKTSSQLCVRLTPAAEALSTREAYLKSIASTALATKLQKLLMLSPHRRLVLSKLVHLGPDFGLPVNFRSRLCFEHPDKFKIVDTSYGRALELVSWNDDLAIPKVKIRNQTWDLIVDRPSKFKLVKLRKGMTVKRRHHDFLIKFEELPDICPYRSSFEDFPKNSLEAEKRACNVVREILGMTTEKRTLIDHLTHFRKDFGLPNKLRGMLFRHPELFYVCLKGQRHSVFLVEAYDDNGDLIQHEEPLAMKEQLLALVREGKRIRREKKWALKNDDTMRIEYPVTIFEHEMEPYQVDEDDALEDLFDPSDFESYDEDSDDEYNPTVHMNDESQFWSSEVSGTPHRKAGEYSDRW